MWFWILHLCAALEWFHWYKTVFTAYFIHNVSFIAYIYINEHNKVKDFHHCVWCPVLDLLTLHDLTPCCNATFLPRFSLWSQNSTWLRLCHSKIFHWHLFQPLALLIFKGKSHFMSPCPHLECDLHYLSQRFPCSAQLKLHLVSLPVTKTFRLFLSRCQCSSALPPTLRLSPFHCGRGLKLQSPEQLETSCSSSLSREGRDTHMHTWHTHTRAHTLSSVVLCADMHWAKVHSATVLTISLSSPPSHRLRLTQETPFQEKC